MEWMRRLSMNQWHSLFGAWMNEDETLPMGPQPLRLSRIMPLPSALPHPTCSLPPLGAGFTASEALGRLPVSSRIETATITHAGNWPWHACNEASMTVFAQAS